MVSEPVSDFLAALALHFPIKHATPEQERAWEASMDADLGRFLPSVLKEAAATIRRTRNYKTFPLPVDCLVVCERIDDRLAMERRAATMPAFTAGGDPEWSSERVRQAYDLCHTLLGRQAAQEGWVRRLWHHCREHCEHPTSDQINRLKREAAEHRALVKECRESAGQCMESAAKLNRWAKAAMEANAERWGSLARLGNGMLSTQERLAAEVLGDMP